MGKGLLFLCCSCFILVLTIVNLSIGPITSGAVKRFFAGGNYPDWGTANCKAAKDGWDAAKDAPNANDDAIKYGAKYVYETCQRAKGMHDMEYTAFIFDIVIGFVCGLIGLLHLFDLKKDFVSNTGLIGLICGIIGFVLTFVYVIFNGLIFTGKYSNQIEGDGDGKYAEKVAGSSGHFKCLYSDDSGDSYGGYAKISDLNKKQYNYKHDFYGSDVPDACKVDNYGETHCTGYVPDPEFADSGTSTALATLWGQCDYLYLDETSSVAHKDIFDRFLTTLILSLVVCLANIGLALFGFLLFRTPGDF